MCLPIFLAGCDTLLIIAGPTYTQRLWCLMEVFVFLQMGGSIERITVVPIDWKDDLTAKNTFEKTDVSKAICTKKVEQKKLLDIVSQGFRNCECFNRIVRHVFRERIKAHMSFEEWQLKLEEVAESSDRLRFRIKMCTTIFGGFLVTLSVLVNQLLASGVLDQDTFGLASYWGAFIAPCGSLMFLGVMPNDSLSVRGVSFFLTACFLLSGIPWMFVAISWWYQYAVETDDGFYDDDEYEEPCQPGAAKIGCILSIIRFFLRGAVAFIPGLFLVKNLYRIKGKTFYDRCERKGFRFKDVAFQIPSRPALDNVWKYGRAWAAAGGACTFAFTTALHLLGDRAPFHTAEHFQSELVSSIVKLFVAVFWTNKRRHRILAFLYSMTAHDHVLSVLTFKWTQLLFCTTNIVFVRKCLMVFEFVLCLWCQAMSATCVAALLGGHNVKESTNMAKDKFRSITFDQLDEHVFDRCHEEMYCKSSDTKLGACDAFISHSSVDDSATKYAAIRRWAIEFKKKHQRWPRLWLDKACIKKNDISNDLLCLPIFLAGRHQYWKNKFKILFLRT